MFAASAATFGNARKSMSSTAISRRWASTYAATVSDCAAAVGTCAAACAGIITTAADTAINAADSRGTVPDGARIMTPFKSG